MDIAPLLEIGLTQGEAKVYLALLRLGESKTGRLAKEAGVSSSKVYKILDRLEKKGLAGHVLRQRVKFFTGVQPRRILDYLDERESEVKKQKALVHTLIPELELERALGVPKEEAAVYEGFKAVQNLYKNMLEELKRGETYHILGAGYSEEVPGMKAFFQNFHTQRAKKGVHVKMLANHDVQGSLVPATQVLSEIRYLPQYLITNMTIAFYKDTAFIFFLVKNPKGFLMKSAEAVRNFRAYFDAFWSIAKK